MKMSPSQGKPRGFTLIELLVVIAIISILAAILFPVFAQARERSRAASCLSNLKQVGIGWLMYAQDYDERLPFGQTYLVSSSPLQYQYWHGLETYTPGSTYYYVSDYTKGLIYPYTKSGQILQCPSLKGEAGRSSYGVSSAVYYYEDGAGTHTGVPLAAVQLPGETVMLADTGTWNNGKQMVVPDMFVNAPSIMYSTTHGRHQGRTNVLWMDGHAKSQRLEFRDGITNAEARKANNLGYITHPKCTFDSACQDYYFEFTKPEIP